MGYYLSSGPIKSEMLKNLLFNCTEKVTGVGLNVKVVIADQGSNNRSLFQTQLGVTQENPYFVVSQRKIYVLYDPPHLIKSVRNNLKKHGFSVNGKPVLWQHIQQFCDLGSANPYGPKIDSKAHRFTTICTSTCKISHPSFEPLSGSWHLYYMQSGCTA